MNYLELQERIWTFLGCQQSGTRRAWRAQLIRDALNNAQARIANTAPYLFGYVRESSISIVAGTQIYTGDDWCKRFISFFTEDAYARKVYYRHPRNVDRDGSRNTGYTLGTVGAFELTWYEKTTTPAKTFTGITVAQDATSVTGLSALGVASLYVGRMLRFNGDSNDYKITAHTDTAATIDKAVKGKVSGESTTITGSGYSSVAVDIGPAQRQRIKIIGNPASSSTIKYRGLFYPRQMILDNDVPELDNDWHHLIWKGALEEVEAFNENAEKYKIYQEQYQIGLQELKSADADLQDSEDTPAYESPLSEGRRDYTPGTYSRFGD